MFIIITESYNHTNRRKEKLIRRYMLNGRIGSLIYITLVDNIRESRKLLKKEVKEKEVDQKIKDKFSLRNSIIWTTLWMLFFEFEQKLEASQHEASH